MTQQLIHLDIAALAVLVLILVSQLTRKMSRGTSNKVFIALVVLTMLGGCLDIWAVTMDNMGVGNYSLRMLAYTLFHIINDATTPLLLVYVISLSSTWETVARNKWLSLVMILPYMADVVLMIANYFNGFLFYYDNGILIMTDICAIPYSIAGVYLVIGAIHLIRYRKLFSKRTMVGMALMIPVMGAAELIRELFPDIMIMVFAGAVGLLMMSVLIQRPEDVIDTFTGLRNYSAYAEDMKKHFLTRSHFTVILINIANYDSLLKMLGYDKSNELLKLITKRLLEQNSTTKSHATAYYLDRGRFRVVVNSLYRNTAEQLAGLIHDTLRQSVKLDRYDLNLIPYVVIANCPEDITTFRSLMAFGRDMHKTLPYNGEVIRADTATMKKTLALLTDVDDIIDRALANHGFKVYYQPIYSIEQKKFISAEALLRLIDEKAGFISPEVFIPAAEKSGAIHKIGDFVLDEVCKFIGSEEFKRLGLEYIEVNLSVSQCMRHGLAERVLSIMNKYGVTPEQINLEITETAASYDQSVMTENLSQLSDAGICFSLDDYGTGYSNMYRIAALPLKIVKLDKTFVNNQTGKMWTILQNTVHMIKDLNMEIVVEGIETEDMVKKFSDLHCDFIQGFYYSKPIPEKDFVEFISRNNKVTTA